MQQQQQSKIAALLTAIKLFLIEKKNRKIFVLGLMSFAILLFTSIFLGSLLVKSSKTSDNNNANTITTPAPTIVPTNPPEEVIQNAGYSIDCQLVITTNFRKLYVQKLDGCNTTLKYQISPSKKYVAYFISSASATLLDVYSLQNNIYAQLRVISQKIIDYHFDQSDNFSVLLDKEQFNGSQVLAYYFIPLLFQGYPSNFYQVLNTFTDIDKKRIEVALPQINDTYSKIMEKSGGLDLLNPKNAIIYVIQLQDLISRLSPTPSAAINKATLPWDTRILFFEDGVFKTMDPDGSNVLTHQFICDGVNIIPIKYSQDYFARSPDGKTLAFLMPTDDQMRNDPNWRSELLAKKNIFDSGEIVLYNFVTGECQRTAIIQSVNFNENFAFSPDGSYLGFVNDGIKLYNLQTKQDYQLSTHNMSNQADSTAVTSPLIWDENSKFIFSVVSKIQNNQPISSRIVRAYFDSGFNGSEDNVLDVPGGSTVYAVSPDANNVLYLKDQTIYDYDINANSSSLFWKGADINAINKLVWLRNDIIVSNLWIGNTGLYFIPLTPSSYFTVDYAGATLLYSSEENNIMQVHVYNLTTNKESAVKDQSHVTSQPLRLFY